MLPSVLYEGFTFSHHLITNGSARCIGSQGVLAAHGQGYRVTTNYNPSYGKWLGNPITLDLDAAESF